MSRADSQTFNVAGMSCEHCVAAVTEEVGQVAGVSDVAVDLASGALVVHGSDVDGEAVRTAVETAGYSLVAPV
jgi:copper chaperone